MKPDRELTVLILGCCLLAGGLGLWPVWAQGEPKGQADEFMEVTAPVGDATTVRVRRIERKMEVIRRLLDGELTLVEAGALFRDLNACPAGMEDVSWRGLPGKDDGERQCRQVIHWAKYEMSKASSPDDFLAWEARVERELEQHIAAHRGVTLPQVISGDQLAE